MVTRSLRKHWFLYALAAAFAGGYQFADHVLPVMEWPYFRNSIVFSVMWMMGVTLKADAIAGSLAKPTAALIAISMNLAGVPLLALPCQFWLSSSLFGGLFVTALVPCTLASASVWTRKAGGDDAVALVTTVVTNLACIVVVPIGLVLVLARQSAVSPWEQLTKLAIVVVLPLVLAQSMRRIRRGDSAFLAGWADRNKTRLSTLAQLGILVMVTLGAAQSAITVAGQGGASAWSPLVAMILLMSTLGLHLLSLLIAILIAKKAKLPPDQQIACGFGGSQKTLMVGLQITMDCGFSVIPMLVYHLGQLLLDTWIAQVWRERVMGTLDGSRKA